MRKLMLGLAAAGALGLAASAVPAHAGVFTGLTAPEVESNRIDARCWHRRRSSRWRCNRWHRRHYYYGPHYYHGPRFFWGPGFYHRRHWW
jgi:hypothetical protein